MALGFEAPLMVPVSPVGVDGWTTLGQARQGETVDGGRSRPWSAGAGSGALATGLAQLAWVLGARCSMAGQSVEELVGRRSHPVITLVGCTRSPLPLTLLNPL